MPTADKRATQSLVQTFPIIFEMCFNLGFNFRVGENTKKTTTPFGQEKVQQKSVEHVVNRTPLMHITEQ
jgi:hypothetical protein